jgi:phage N-6-adenine-methyltransferase
VTLNTALMFSSARDDWQTPPDLCAKLNHEFRLKLDVAAHAGNTKCQYWYGPGGLHEDALSVPWEPGYGACWMNPPYSRGLQRKFIVKAFDERRHGVTTVALLPARTDTLSFHDYIYQRSGVEVRFLKGRIKFVGARHGAPFPSMVVIFRGKQ